MCQTREPQLFHYQSSFAQPEETSLTQRISSKVVLFTLGVSSGTWSPSSRDASYYCQALHLPVSLQAVF